VDSLLAVVRKACPVGLWSQGVKLAREDAVAGERRSDGEVVVRVRAAGHAVPPTVTLYPADEEWDCDCRSKVDPCQHVAAAIIALCQAEDEGRDLFGGSAGAGHIRYELSRDIGAIAVARFLVGASGEAVPLPGRLVDLVARKSPELTIAPTHDDLSIDRMLGPRTKGSVVLERVGDLLSALSSAEDVRFEGQSVSTSAERVSPRARVFDDKKGVVLLMERDPRITEMVIFDVVRCGDVLHPIGEPELGGHELEKLPARRLFTTAQLGELVGEVFPALEARIQVDIESRRLPNRARRELPRVHFEVDQDEHTLGVMPLLVYGDPPRARIDAGKLVHLHGDVPKRDESAERDLMHRLRDELDLAIGRRVHFDGHDAARFVTRLERWQSTEGASRSAPWVEASELIPRLDLTASSLSVEFEVTSKDGQVRHASADAVLRAHWDGLAVAPLEDGGFAPIPVGWLSQHGDRLADLLAARDANGRLATAALPTLGELCDALDQPRPPELERLRPLLQDFAGIPDAPLPEDLTAELRPYQRAGVSWLRFASRAGLGAVLADDMGLGKTLQALCAIEGRTLVVCPRSVVHGWANEIRKFRPSLRSALYHGPKRELDESADVTITTYAMLRNDAEVLTGVRWGTVILDEAQAIKNPDSQAARAAYRLQADFRMSLSGTPVENRLEELWSQLHFTNPGLLGGRSRFDERYARPIAEGGSDAAEELRRRIRPFVLRRLKRVVAPELPPRTESVLLCELEAPERAVYDAVRAATKKDLVARMQQGGGVMAALEALLRLRQAACHPALVPGQEADTSSKVQALCGALSSAASDGHKALVFSQWTSLLDRVEPHLEAAGLAFTRLDGSTRDREAVVDSFQDPAGPPIMLISLKAGGTGLNLTAADHVFLLDPWWNPAVEDQAADRAHRIGQDRPVNVYRLVAKDTVEEKILALQEKKRALADAALGEAGAAASLTKDDLMALLD